MKRHRLPIIIVLFIIAADFASAQNSVSIGFYNTENLFDTIPSTIYDDGDYTPAGRNRWNTERYRIKLAAVARVLDDMNLDVVGLCEVENEGVVRDLVMTLSTDYNYIFHPGSSSGGRNAAMLYKGDKFVPERVRTIPTGTSRRMLYVRGNLCGARVDIAVCHLPSLLNARSYRRRALDSVYAFADSLHRVDTASRLVVMGDFNMTPKDKAFRETFGHSRSPLRCPLERNVNKGEGSYAYDNRWLLYDIILLDPRLNYRESGVFVRPYMLRTGAGKRRGYPFRTFSGRLYTGGPSDHLPVYVVVAVP